MMFILKSLSWFFGALPLPVALAAGRGLGWIYGSVLRFRRAEVLATLQRSFPERSLKDLKRIRSSMYANLGMNVVESLRVAGIDQNFVDRHITLLGEERIDEARKEGSGVLVLTAHVGNWEMLCVIAPMFGHRLTIVAKAMKSESLTRFIKQTRGRFGTRALPSKNVYRECLRVLRNKETLGFILDQNRTQVDGVFVDFFGKPACTSIGLALLSYQAKAPVVPVFAVRKPGGHHEMHLLPVIEPPPNREPETIRAYTQRYTTEIENMIRQYPDQWIWVHRRWRTQPPRDFESTEYTEGHGSGR